MSETFVTNSGGEVRYDEIGWITHGNHIIGPTAAHAFREFFQHERDKELGRWRWPENPEYVVYPKIFPAHEQAFGPNLSVMVFHEPTGVLKGYCRSEDEGGSHREYPRAARAYFDAHREPLPTEPGTVLRGTGANRTILHRTYPVPGSDLERPWTALGGATYSDAEAREFFHNKFVRLVEEE